MPRKPGIVYFGALYYVIFHDNDGEMIFFSDNDRIRFYPLIQEELNSSNTVSIKPKATLDKIIVETCRYSHLEEKDFSIQGKDHKLSV